MERHMRLSRAAVVLVTIALIAAIAAAVWFASPEPPYVPSEDSGAALGAAAPAEDGTVAGGYQPSGKGISEGADTPNSAITTIRNSGNGSYYLTSNIVVNSLTDCVFSGTLDGNGKTIYIRYDSEVTGEPGVDPEYVGIGALFGNLDGATIKNAKIVVETFRYVEGSAGTRNVGIIAGDAWGGVTIENVYVELQYSPNSNGRSYFLDSGEHGSWPGIDVELNFGAVLGKSGSSDTDTDVTLKNVTVDNQTTGDYGFSAWIRHGNNCDYKVSMGHFVGWVTGELLMQNCTLRGGESAKMTIKRGGSGGSTTNQSGAVIGRLDEQSGSKPSLTIAGLDMELAINFDDHAVMNNINGNNGIIYGNDANNAYTVSVSDIFWNENSGNPGWYDGQGNDTITYSNLTKYDPNTIGVSFDKDGDKVLLSAKAQYIDKAEINSITFNNVTYSVWDKLIATDTKAVGQWTQVVTVAKPNLKTGGSITYTTEMGTGTFSLEGGETITGVSGNSYTVEREYDGNVPQSPSVVLSSGGGSYADVWKTTNASANVGQYTMTFDKNAFTDAVVATGSDGLTYIAKNGIVYSPGSMDQIGQLNIVNNINVNITKASVTVTPNVPDDDLYTGNRLPALTATAVDSGGKAVEGDIAWDEPDATLISGKSSYAWTWTPNSSNYQTVKDSMELEAFDRKIERLSVQDDYKKEYTAFEPFDSTSVKVIAYYTDGSSEQLVNDECKFEVENGDINKLVVTDVTVTVSLKKGSDVSTKISIFVSKLAVGIPTAIQGRVYNGGEQTGVDEGEHYWLSDNTGTNADNYTATAELKDKDNTEWSTGGTDNVTIPWTIAQMTLDGTVSAAGSLEYDGNEKDAAFTVTVGTLCGSDQVTFDYGAGDRINVTDGGFTATAQLPNNGNYKWATDAPSASFTIDPMPVEIGLADVSDKTYDGNVVDPNSLFIAPNGVNGEGALQLEFVITVDDENSNEILNAGTYTVTAVLADGQTNYTAQSAQARYEIAKVVLTGTLTFDGTATYDGTQKTATFTLTSDNLVGQDKVGEVTYNDVDRINVTGQAIVASVALPSSGNYQWQDGVEPTASLTIVKATPAVTVELSDDMPGNLTVAATLDNAWLVRTDNTGVEGTLAWDKEGELLQQGKVEYGWTFVPTDSNNYNSETGFLSITASEDTLQSITVKEGTYKTEYTAYEDFDPTGLVVIAHYMSGAEVEVTSGFTLENDEELTDGKITVTLNSVSTTITVTVNKREIPLPTATEGLIFNGEEQNGIDQKWIEQYAEFVKVEGNLQTNAGDYQATVTLTKDTKYVTWEGGSDADVSIPWTIAQMTLDGTVSAEGSLEYDGNEKDAAFTVTVGELCGSDQVTFDYGAGDRINVTDGGFTATAQLPSSGNYKWATDAPSASFTVTPKSVVIGLADVSGKTYDGNVVDPNSLFIAPNGVGGGALALTVTVDGGEEILNAGSYTVTAVLAQGQPNYTAKQAVAKYNVSKADPTVNPTADVQGTLYTSDDLYKIALNLAADDTPGTVKWDEGQRLIADEQGYNWTFVPTDSVNYNGATGVIRLTAVQAALTDIRVTLSDVTEYTAYDAFDRDGIVVEAVYGDVIRAVGDYELSFSSGTEDRLVAGEITVTVSYGDGGASFEESFVIVVAKLVVEKPVVGDTTFEDNGETITLPIAESKYYTITGNTGFGVGSYLATVSLVDADNTVWADGSVDDISISWAITESVSADEVVAAIMAMEKVTWQNAEEFLDLEARYDALDASEKTAEATAKLEVLRAQYGALRNAAFDDIEAAHEVTAKSLGKALAAAAAGLSAAAIALAIAKRRSI